MHRKVQFVLSCAHAQAFYSCEASSINESALRYYTSILLKVVGTGNVMRARSLIFAFGEGPLNLDPYVELFTRRLLMLRRTWIKVPSIRPVVHEFPIRTL